MNMEQQGLTEEEVCVNYISCKEFSTQFTEEALLSNDMLI